MVRTYQQLGSSDVVVITYQQLGSSDVLVRTYHQLGSSDVLVRTLVDEYPGVILIGAFLNHEMAPSLHLVSVHSTVRMRIWL